MWALFSLVVLVCFSCVYLQFDDNCKCVSYFLCKNGTIVTDGDVEGIITEKLGGCRCNNCPENEVCCRLETNITTSHRAKPTSCGVRNPDGVGYRIDGNKEELKFGEFPWIVDILVDSGAYRCGGSLIHPSVVLTAAHCVVRKKTYIVRAGDWDSSKTDEFLKHQDLRVSSVKIHEDYNPAVFYNDIALLFLNGEFKLSDHIQPICLPASNAEAGKERCYVGGRGKDQSGQYQPILKKIDIPLVDKNVCQTSLRNTASLGKYFTVHRSALCAGGEKNKDACIGDGGSPLICPIEGEDEVYQQIGIVSWGLGCYQEEPAVYTNVRFLRDWIDKQMKEQNLVTTYYTH